MAYTTPASDANNAHCPSTQATVPADTGCQVTRRSSSTSSPCSPPAPVILSVVDDARETLNPNLRLAGPVSNPTAIVSTRAGLFLSSGALPGRNLDNPASLESHVRSSLNSLGRTLADHGLRWHDVFFIRAMPTPQPDRPTPDSAAWVPVYETLGELTSRNAPPYTLWRRRGSAPQPVLRDRGLGCGARAGGRLRRAGPDGAESFVADVGLTAQLHRNGATIGPNAELAWLSGVVAPAGTAPTRSRRPPSRS